MRLKIDENLPVEVAQELSAAGHEAVTVHDQQLVGEADTRLAAVCRDEARSLVSLDLDFADIRVYPPGDYAGLIVLRPRTQSKPAVLSLVRRLLPLLETEPLEGNLWIVDETGVRIREGESGPDAAD